MKILIATPPRRPGYNNTLHLMYADMGETIGYLKQNTAAEIRFSDLGSSSEPWGRFIWDAEQADAVIFYARVWDSPEAKAMSDIIRHNFPGKPIIIFGDAPIFIPQYFMREPFTGFATAGSDQEEGLRQVIEMLDGKRAPGQVMGAHINDGSPLTLDNRVRIPYNKWAFPDIDALPLDHYRTISQTMAKIGNMVAVHYIRGCGTGCGYCPETMKGGDGSRYRNPDETAAWIRETVSKYGFDGVKVQAPDFAANKEAAYFLCGALLDSGGPIRYQVDARVDSLDKSIVAAMGESGCVRVGFGVEDLRQSTGRSHKTNEERLRQMAGWLKDAGISASGYVMIGMPGQTFGDVIYTYDLLKELGIKPRPSMYTPFQSLATWSAEELDHITPSLDHWDKTTFVPSGNSQISEEQYWQLMVSNLQYLGASRASPRYRR